MIVGAGALVPILRLHAAVFVVVVVVVVVAAVAVALPDDDEDLRLDKVHMVEARRVPSYECFYEPKAVEDGGISRQS
jgi:hypothetical protein